MLRLLGDHYVGIVLTLGYSFGAFLILDAWTRKTGSVRVRGVSVVPMLAGLALIVIVVVVYPGEMVATLPRLFHNRWTIAAFGAAVVGGAALSDLVLARLVPATNALLQRLVRGTAGRRDETPARVRDAVAAVCCGVAVALFVAGSWRLIHATGDTSPQGVVRVVVEARYPLPGKPMSLAFSDLGYGYVALAEGQVLRFAPADKLTTGLPLDVVAEGLAFPRGMAVAGGELFLVELGPLPCTGPPLDCDGAPDLSTRQVQELRFLEAARARVIAFGLLPDGRLGRSRTVLADLPVVNTAHAPNGMTSDVNGRIYLSIGNLDALWQRPEAVKTIQGPHLDLLGTVIAFGSSDKLEVVARGLRNVYGLTMDRKGRLYGVDNDGDTLGGYRREEVLHIRPGAHFGYPYEGTFGQYQVRTDGPLWVADSIGSAGLEWAEHAGLQPGLLIGSLGRLDYLPVRVDGDRPVIELPVHRLANFRILQDLPGYVTAVKADASQRLWVAMMDIRGSRDSLYVLRVLQ